MAKMDWYIHCSPREGHGNKWLIWLSVYIIRNPYIIKNYASTVISMEKNNGYVQCMHAKF